MYTYSWYHWITFFFLYSFFGWVIESAFVSLIDRRFVNRGFLRLPLLPLYGTGAVLLLWLTLPVQDHIILVFLVGMIGATALEYVTGYVMERLFKMKYWDYSSQPFNLNGYICLPCSISWGVLTVLLTKVIHRPIAEFVLKLDPRIEITFLVIVGAAFVADSVVSVKEALDLTKVLEAMTRLKAELDDAQVQASLLKAEIEQKIEERRAEIRAGAAMRGDAVREEWSSRMSEKTLRAAEAKGAAKARIAEAKGVMEVKAKGEAEANDEVKAKGEAETKGEAESREEAEVFVRERRQREKVLADRARALREKRRGLLKHTGFYRRNLLRGNPTATSARFSEALDELRKSLEEK